MSSILYLYFLAKSTLFFWILLSSNFNHQWVECNPTTTVTAIKPKLVNMDRSPPFNSTMNQIHFVSRDFRSFDTSPIHHLSSQSSLSHCSAACNMQLRNFLGGSMAIHFLGFFILKYKTTLFIHLIDIFYNIC